LAQVGLISNHVSWSKIAFTTRRTS